MGYIGVCSQVTGFGGTTQVADAEKALKMKPVSSSQNMHQGRARRRFFWGGGEGGEIREKGRKDSCLNLMIKLTYLICRIPLKMIATYVHERLPATIASFSMSLLVHVSISSIPFHGEKLCSCLLLLLKVDGGRVIRVTFDGGTADTMPWKFRPTQGDVRVSRLPVLIADGS